MTPEEVHSMIAEDRREWALLCETLDARPDVPLHDPESPAWTSRDVYAHLARWINNSTDNLESWLASRTLLTPPEGDDDTINARWQAEDAGLSLAEARERAQQAFDRRIRAIEAVPPERWDGDKVLDAIAHADDAHHYRAHRGYIDA